MHRIWALVDRQSYADFWMGIYEEKGVTYFVLMGLLAGLCILGIVTFIRERKANHLWRWIYVFGGIILIIFLIFLIILYYSPRYKEGKNLYLISIGFALFGIFIIVILLFYNIFKSKNVGKEIDDFVSEDLIKYLSTIQKELSNEIIFSYDKKKKMIIMNYPLENKKETLRRLRLEKRNEVALNSEHNLLPSKDLKNLSNLELFSNNNYNGTDFSKLQKNGKRKGE